MAASMSVERLWQLQDWYADYKPDDPRYVIAPAADLIDLLAEVGRLQAECRRYELVMSLADRSMHVWLDRPCLKSFVLKQEDEL